MTRARDRFENAPARAYTHAEADQLIGEMRFRARMKRKFGQYYEYKVWANRHSPLGVEVVTPHQFNLLSRYFDESIRLTFTDEQQGAAEAEPIGERPRPLERAAGQPPAQAQRTPRPGDTSIGSSEAA